jgi:hypothetical protein
MIPQISQNIDKVFGDAQEMIKVIKEKYGDDGLNQAYDYYTKISNENRFNAAEKIGIFTALVKEFNAIGDNSKVIDLMKQLQNDVSASGTSLRFVQEAYKQLERNINDPSWEIQKMQERIDSINKNQQDKITRLEQKNAELERVANDAHKNTIKEMTTGELAKEILNKIKETITKLCK